MTLKNIEVIVKRLLNRLKYKALGQLPSLFNALTHIIPLSLLEKEVTELKDWRTIVTNLARSSNVSEDALLYKIGLHLNLPILDKVPPFNLAILPAGLSIDDFIRVAAIPFVKNGQILGIICVDPQALKVLRLEIRRFDIYLARWTLIHKALMESRIIYKELGQGIKGLESGASRGEEETLSSEIVKRLIQEVIAHGQNEAVIHFEAEAISYEFILDDGRKGSGTINSKLTANLLRYLRDIRGDKEIFIPALRGEVESSIAVCPSVKFIPGSLTSVELSWGQSRIAPKRSPLVKAGPGGNLLLIEDNRTFSKVVCRYLTINGFTVHEFSSASDALAFLEESDRSSVGAIITDIHLPEMNGLKLLRILRERGYGLPIIALTSDVDPTLELEALSLGVDAFITKNENPQILLLHVERITGVAAFKADSMVAG